MLLSSLSFGVLGDCENQVSITQERQGDEGGSQEVVVRISGYHLAWVQFSLSMKDLASEGFSDPKCPSLPLHLTGDFL